MKKIFSDYPKPLSWVMYQNGTFVLLDKLTGEDERMLRRRADTLMKPTVAGTESADFSVNVMDRYYPDSTVATITYGDSGLIMNIVIHPTAIDAKLHAQIGLKERENRHNDALYPVVVCLSL